MAWERQHSIPFGHHSVHDELLNHGRKCGRLQAETALQFLARHPASQWELRVVAAQYRVQPVQQRTPAGQAQQRVIVQPHHLPLCQQCFERRLRAFPVQAALFE